MSDRISNLVLQSLANADAAVFSRLMAEAEPHPLHRGELLGTPRAATDFIYFVECGVVSVVASTRSGNSLEVALVGREGVAGIADALGTQALPYGLVVQLPGLAYRVSTGIIREHIQSCSTLHELLMDYSQGMMHQLAQSAVCNRFHTSVQRLSRWLLLTAERSQTNRFELTHEFVSQMVGAPRPVVSQSLSTLRYLGAIDYRRGVLTVLDARKLHKYSCECYDVFCRVSNGLATAPVSAVAQRK
jgi:CRP-like cAMP-binding protein